MTQLMSISKDINGVPTYCRIPSTDMFGVQLAANTAQSFTVPNTFAKWDCVFSFDPGLRVYVSTTTTAAVFGGTIGAVSSELNPMGYQLAGGTVVSLITPDTNAYVGVALYGLL